MQNRKITYLLTVLITLLSLSSCTNSNTIQTGSYKYLYDYESRTLHPEYVIYHFSDDSSTVYFRVNSEELLYARTASQSPFTAKLRINCKMTNENSTDTTSIQITDPAKEKNGWLIGSFNINMQKGKWNILMEFTDVTRNLTQYNYLFSDKSSHYSSQNYLIRHKSTLEPVFGGQVTIGSEVTIESTRNRGGVPPHVILIDNENKLPPPPFSSNKSEIPTIGTNYFTLTSIDSMDRYTLSTLDKNYFISNDDNLQAGLLLRTTSVDFPTVKQAKSLEWPLRYITTKTEYEQITKNTYPKKLIDNFWIECAGSKNRARDLIRIYYSRVEEANYYYSSNPDGWRPDRGMIHLIFGNPTKINKFSDREVWQYGEDNTTNQLIFVFNKESNPLSNNIYTLNRDPAFKPYWERMVTVWRNGRIYND